MAVNCSPATGSRVSSVFYRAGEKFVVRKTLKRKASGLSIYVHWPYCKSICPYCDFNRYKRDHIDHASMQKCYNKTFEHFFQANKEALYPYTHVESVFFGGGTPSTADPLVFHDIIQRVHSLNASMPSPNEHIEISMEANPTSIEMSRIEQFKQAGINRLSIGVQSFDSEDLLFLGRQHSTTEAKKAIQVAQDLFQDRVSIDLMFGTEKHAKDEGVWDRVLDEAMELGLSHISLYQLTIEKYTQFYKRMKKGELVLPDEECSERLYQAAIDKCSSHGLEQYEISNFAKRGYEAKHNVQYWKSGDYLGIGPGAHSRITDSDNKRVSMVQLMKPEDWMSEIFSPMQCPSTKIEGTRLWSLLGNVKSELTDEKQRAEEIFMMGLRLLRDGVVESELSFHMNRITTFEQLLNNNMVTQLQEHNFIVVESLPDGDRRIRVTHKGKGVLDELLATLFR